MTFRSLIAITPFHVKLIWTASAKFRVMTLWVGTFFPPHSLCLCEFDPFSHPSLEEADVEKLY